MVNHARMWCVPLAAALCAGCSADEGGRPHVPEGSKAAEAPEQARAMKALPAEVESAVAAAVPDMQVTEFERKERDGRVYYDVEGVRGDGSEIELDLLEEAGAFKVVEIQRDIPWAEAPAGVREAAASARAFEPARVIESKQTDGSVIYEIFAPDAPAKPALEVRLADGKAEVLKEEWPH